MEIVGNVHGIIISLFGGFAKVAGFATLLATLYWVGRGWWNAWKIWDDKQVVSLPIFRTIAALLIVSFLGTMATFHPRVKLQHKADTRDKQRLESVVKSPAKVKDVSPDVPTLEDLAKETEAQRQEQLKGLSLDK